MADEKPDTRHLVLKPREIDPMDKISRPGDGTQISVRLMHRENALAAEKSSRRKSGKGPPAGVPSPPDLPQPLPEVFKAKEIMPLDPPVAPGDEESINVPDILLENRIAEEESGWGRVKGGRRKSRRNRDFILIVGTIDLAFAVFIKAMSSTVSTIFGVAGITLVTTTFAWIMFVVNDDY